MDKLKCDACGHEYEEPIWQPYDIRYNDEDTWTYMQIVNLTNLLMMETE